MLKYTYIYNGFITKIPSVWVGDDNTEYTVQDYISQSPRLKAFSYIIYIVLWFCGLHLLKLFNTKYDRSAIITGFLLGVVMIFALDWINDLSWEIAINKADHKYYLINNAGPFISGYRIMNKNNVFKMKKPNHKLLLIDAYKYKKYLENGEIKDEPFRLEKRNLKNHVKLLKQILYLLQKVYLIK